MGSTLNLVVGPVLISSGLVMWPVGRGTAILAVAAGLAWFAGDLGAPLASWHRGPLTHLLIAFPGWRPASMAMRVVIAAGYLAAVLPSDWVSPVLNVALVTVLLALRFRAGGGRREQVAAWATAAFAAVVYAAAVSRLAFPAGEVASAVNQAYQVVVAGLAVALASTARRRHDEAVTDLVVELSQQGAGTIRAALAATLGDPGLRVGYWRDGRYLDQAGAPVDGEVATFVAQEDGPLAVIVHDRSVLTDPALVAAVGAAIRLTAANAALQAALQENLAELAASRRRLLVTADDERRRLRERMHEGPIRRLESLLAVTPCSPHLRQAVEELSDLARGLHPRDLSAGLAPALAVLADRSTVPVRLRVDGDRQPADWRPPSTMCAPRRWPTWPNTAVPRLRRSRLGRTAWAGGS
ncbi:hypothetical protein ACIBH1_12055 [Nonomuraea sp. NPDC050663]|uniref:hypothetical protein n=1 Tax=Nonomuraea sp. NPDC050663 TaxID=3364370 RepID=UPI00378D4E0C